MRVAFTKMHGLGNDFVVIDATARPFEPTPEQIERLADRRRGVGCDQVLVIDPPPDADADWGYRIYNADGGRVGQCGNGVRCLVRWLHEHGRIGAGTVRVATGSARMRAELLADGQVRVDMGPPRFSPAEVPIAADAEAERYTLAVDGEPALEIGAVGFGNPHAVILAADLERAPVATLGAALQSHPAFPEQVNVGFAQPVDRRHLRLRVYERGVGETMACGSGACAAAVVGIRWGLLDPEVTVTLPGGELRIQWSGRREDSTWMTGPATTVFHGEIEL